MIPIPLPHARRQLVHPAQELGAEGCLSLAERQHIARRIAAGQREGVNAPVPCHTPGYVVLALADAANLKLTRAVIEPYAGAVLSRTLNTDSTHTR